MKHYFSILIVLVLILSSTSVVTAREEEPDESVRCRGKYLRTEITGELEEPQLACSLAIKDGYPALVMRRQIKKSTIGVKMYETLLRVFISGDIGDVGSYEYKVVPDEYWKGEEVITTEVREDGLLPGMGFTVNGVFVVSDSEAYVVDRPGEGFGILDYFDNFDNHSMTISISAKEYQPCEFKIFRSMPQRQPHDEKLLQEPLTQEILYAYGLDFVQGKNEPERENIHIEIKNDDIMRPNVPFCIEITVTNKGEKPANSLVARCFSREPWINGKWFYFGNIEPGASLSFKRFVIPDTVTNADRSFMEMRFKDSWGNLPKLSRQLCVPIQKVSQTEK